MHLKIFHSDETFIKLVSFLIKWDFDVSLSLRIFFNIDISVRKSLSSIGLTEY